MKLQLKGRRYQHKSCVFSALSPLSDGKCTRHVARLASLKRFRRWWRFMLIFRVHWIKVFATQLNFSLMANSGSTIARRHATQAKLEASFIWCHKVTNLYYIAVHSISLQNGYKIVIRFIRKIFPYSSAARCRSYYKNMPYRRPKMEI